MLEDLRSILCVLQYFPYPLLALGRCDLRSILCVLQCEGVLPYTIYAVIYGQSSVCYNYSCSRAPANVLWFTVNPLCVTIENDRALQDLMLWFTVNPLCVTMVEDEDETGQVLWFTVNPLCVTICQTFHVRHLRLWFTVNPLCVTISISTSACL